MVALIEARGLWREFRTAAGVVTALRDASVDVARGKITLLQGRSGSGKTTLINMLGALDYPTRGAVVFDGTSIQTLSESERDEIRRLRMGFVFQSVGLISLMSAYENVEFGLRIADYDRATREQRAAECLALVGLSKRMTHMPGELSGGEQQRVAIARAIAHKPAVIFADEPTAELDTFMGEQVMRTFRSLVEEEGVTVVVSSHDVAMADMVDDVIALEDGTVVNGR